MVRSAKHLKATIGASRPVDGNHAARELGKKTAVVIPVTIILVPLPGAPFAGLLIDHLVMIVVNLASQQLFHPVNDAIAAHERTFDVSAKLVVHRQPDDSTFPIATPRGLIHTIAIGARNLAEKRDLIDIEQSFNDHITIFLELRELRIVQESRHREWPFVLSTCRRFERWPARRRVGEYTAYRASSPGLEIGTGCALLANRARFLTLKYAVGNA